MAPKGQNTPRFGITGELWQCKGMPKAYRTDVAGHQKFQGEIRTLKDAFAAERVGCPEAGCECIYEMYGSQPSAREANITILQERLRREHPGHTSEVLGVNEFRKFPR
jgi:hypothetical protein